ncbi:hypothetical protein GCM10022377_27380 [Zhihengliuella alba]|uniref:Uncharacterized protein n=1 Tax=Zhihengliuella alba TaxID=547018 RepID=A0ABP7DZL2_9MICC
MRGSIYMVVRSGAEKNGVDRLVGKLAAVGGAEGQIPPEIPTDVAIGYVDEYFARRENGRPKYSGSHFETFGGGGLSRPNEFSAEDLLATSLLSKPVSGQAAVGILGPAAEELSGCLSELPTDRSFEDLTEEEFARLLDDSNSPAQRAWDLLRQHEDPWWIGPTAASKLLARKRPQLIPVYDSFVKAQAGLSGSGKQWTLWREAFQHDGFVRTLREIRDASAGRQLSLLRVLDVVLWMHHARGLNIEGDADVADEMAAAE